MGMIEDEDRARKRRRYSVRRESTVADALGYLPARTAGRRLDAATRERLLLVLQEELRRASEEAVSRGVSPEALSVQLDERIARLRAQINDLDAPAEPGQA
jgi:hypothetical protein